MDALVEEIAEATSHAVWQNSAMAAWMSNFLAITNSRVSNARMQGAFFSRQCIKCRQSFDRWRGQQRRMIWYSHIANIGLFHKLACIPWFSYEASLGSRGYGNHGGCHTSPSPSTFSCFTTSSIVSQRLLANFLANGGQCGAAEAHRLQLWI